MRLDDWFASRGWKPFQQREVWDAPNGSDTRPLTERAAADLELSLQLRPAFP